MGIQVACDNPEARSNDEESFDVAKSVRFQVLVSDPETGNLNSQAFFCSDHGDKVYAALKELGFPDFEL